MADKKEKAKPQGDGVRKVAVGVPAPAGKGEVKAGPIQKWEEGLEVEGAFLGLRSIVTQYGAGELLEIGFRDGRKVTFGAPVILANRLRGIAYGVSIVVRCLGKTTTKNGQEAWDFKVWADGVNDADIPF